MHCDRVATNLEYSGISLNIENSGEKHNKQSIFGLSFKYLCKTVVDLLYCGS